MAEHPGDIRPMSVSDWFITILVLAIPIVNVIMYIVWAFDRSGNVNRRNFCIASIIWGAIAIVLAVLIVMIQAILFV